MFSRSNFSRGPILLCDAMKGTSELFLLDYRTHSALGFDSAVVNSGAVVWRVALDPRTIPSSCRRIARTARTRTSSLRCSCRAPNRLMDGNSAYWGREEPFSLKWMDDRDSGVRVTVDGTSQSSGGSNAVATAS